MAPPPLLLLLLLLPLPIGCPASSPSVGHFGPLAPITRLNVLIDGLLALNSPPGSTRAGAPQRLQARVARLERPRTCCARPAAPIGHLAAARSWRAQRKLEEHKLEEEEER